MVVPIQNLQTKLGRSTTSRLALIFQGNVQFVCSQSLVQFCFSIEKFNNTTFDNSMSTIGMEFFVPAASVLINAFKQD